MRYNPLAYIRSEKDILKLVNALIMNTKGEGDKSGEDFWVKAERLYYSALIGYIWYEATEDEKTLSRCLIFSMPVKPGRTTRNTKAPLTSFLLTWRKKTRTISLSSSIRNSRWPRAKH